MKIFLKPTDPLKFDVDILLQFVFEDELMRELSSFPGELSAQIKEGSLKEDFQGSEGQTLILSTKGLVSSYKIAFIGLGKKEDFDIAALQESVALGIRKSKEVKAVKVGLSVKKEWFDRFDTTDTVRAIVEASHLSDYQFLLYKSEGEKKKIRQIAELLLSVPAGRIRSSEQALEYANIISRATIYARDLVNEPPQLTTPAYLSQQAEKIARESKGLVKVTVLEEDDAKKLGLNAFLGVTRGSDEPAKFIILKYKNSRPKQKIVIIGKSVTFDTGGLSLKNADNMETMKLDMSGGASILAVFQALPDLNPSLEIIGLIPACENMPSGKALKPGDILRAYNGKTIEVLNTDAEGRLTLADALSYAVKREKPDEIIDIATLTGACQVALGQDIAGLWGNDNKILSAIENSAKITGEKVWRMPLEKKYKALIKSHITDVKNIQTGKYGGAITGALFLQEFVDNIPWVHLDIAGPAFAEKDSPLCPQGGVGFGVRLLLHYLTTK